MDNLIDEEIKESISHSLHKAIMSIRLAVKDERINNGEANELIDELHIVLEKLDNIFI